jgi:uncharacterized protein (TIGR03086 family)
VRLWASAHGGIGLPRSGNMAGAVMTENAERYRVVALGFTRRAEAVQDAAWLLPAPCEGWVASDIVRHLVDWVPPFLNDGAGITFRAGPSADTDPAKAWLTLSDQIQSLLDNPDQAARIFDHPRAGRHRLEDAVMMFVLADVLIHTWDLARATGLDETLDTVEVIRMFNGIQEVDEMLRQSGQYGPKIDVDADADVQTRLLAFLGRQP